MAADREADAKNMQLTLTEQVSNRRWARHCFKPRKDIGACSVFFFFFFFFSNSGVGPLVVTGNGRKRGYLDVVILKTTHSESLVQYTAGTDFHYLVAVFRKMYGRKKRVEHPN